MMAALPACILSLVIHLLVNGGCIAISPASMSTYSIVIQCVLTYHELPVLCMYCLIVSHHLQSLLSSSNWYLIVTLIMFQSYQHDHHVPAVSPDINHHSFIWTYVILLRML